MKSNLRVAAERAAFLFEKFGWTWQPRVDEPPYVPNTNQIEETFYHLQQAIIERGGTSSFTGRLRVDKTDNIFDYLVEVGSSNSVL